MHAPPMQKPPRPAVAGRHLSVIKEWDWPTLAVLVGCAVVYFVAMSLPAGWGVVQFFMLAFALTLHSSLSHELLHWTGARQARAASVLGFIQPGLFVPYFRFKALHLAHHQDAKLTDPYDDPETQYLDPAVWVTLPRWKQQLLRFNNTLFGRMAVGPVIGMIGFIRADWLAVRSGERAVLTQWVAHLPSVALTLWWVSLSSITLWVYLAACYAALSVLRIRTFLEHRAHERASGRTVIIEDRGVLAFLFLNNNYHAVHHMHPKVAWHRLPALYRSRKEHYLGRNQGYVYRSYAQVFASYFFRAKDPVAHPLWQPKRD